jgi:hypothetical protein
MMVWMRSLAGLALLLAAAFGVVYWMGRRLPVQHRAVASGRVEASQDAVWRLVDDPATHAAWRKGIIQISMQPGEERCWIETHRSMDLMLCPVEVVPKARKAVRVAEKDMRFGGTWTYELTPLGADATEVTVTEDGYVPPPLWRFLGHYVMGEETDVRQFVADLQAEAMRKR